MIDIELFRRDPKIYDAEIKKRGMKIDTSLGISLDSKKRKLKFKVDELRAKKNDASKIIPTLKGEKKNKLIAEMKEINAGLKEFEEKLNEFEKQYRIHFSAYPNLTHESTPVGTDESGNIVHSIQGTKPEFDFNPKNHIELGTALDILDEERARKVSGSRFVYIKNEGVLLEFALVQFVLNVLVAKGFAPLIPPYSCKRGSNVRNRILSGRGIPVLQD